MSAMSAMSGVCAVVLFSGPGGSSEGLRQAGVASLVGVEKDADAARTARAAGFTVVEGDVAAVDPRQVVADHLAADRLLIQSSPPCQGLSMAGGGAGRVDLVHLLTALTQLAEGIAARHEIGLLAASLVTTCSDERSPLTFETVRWVSDLEPDYVFLEQVPAALPIWEAIGELLRAWGYSTWSGNVHSEQFGLAQTRKRAVLLASRHTQVTEPAPTHSRFHTRTVERLDPGVEPWTTMAEALGWACPACDGNGCWEMVSNYGTGGDPAGRCPTFRDAVRAEVEPRVHNQSGTAFDLAWPAYRPAPVVAGREIITMPGANANRFNGATKSRNDGLRLSAAEAGLLQGFPADYPWRGTKTSQHTQVGNAVPPPLARALAEHLFRGAPRRAADQVADLVLARPACEVCSGSWDEHDYSQREWVICA